MSASEVSLSEIISGLENLMRCVWPAPNVNVAESGNFWAYALMSSTRFAGAGSATASDGAAGASDGAEVSCVVSFRPGDAVHPARKSRQPQRRGREKRVIWNARIHRTHHGMTTTFRLSGI